MGGFWLFATTEESRDPETGILRRHHLHEDVYGRVISRAAQEAGIEKWVTSHSLRHTFATLLLQRGTDIRTVHELLGHQDVATTMIYTHAATGVGRTGVKSPVDSLAFSMDQLGPSPVAASIVGVRSPAGDRGTV